MKQFTSLFTKRVSFDVAFFDTFLVIIQKLSGNTAETPIANAWIQNCVKLCQTDAILIFFGFL